MRTPIKWLYWLFPPLFCLFVYWYALNGWFQQDDFVWLGLSQRVHSWHDLIPAVFRPTIQGTWRPWSDRVFFLLFRSLFGLRALPYHVWIFLTQFANLALIGLLVRRLTGSRLAGFWAPIFWIGNSVILMTMSLACLYKDILCSFCLLLAFHLLLLHIETGERRYYLWQWIVFLLGFGAMETNLVYPAIATSYVLLLARPHLRKTLPLFIPSILYVALNLLFVKKQTAGPYAMHIDWSIPYALARYWLTAVEPTDPGKLTGLPDWSLRAGAVILTVVLAAFVVWQGRRKNWLPIFFLSWFVCGIAPVLPLREQFMPYYLTVASIGLAMLAGYALSIGIENRGRQARVWRTAAVALALLFLVPSVTEATKGGRWWRDRSRRVQNMVAGIARAHELHPGKTILLLGVDDTLFWGGIKDGCFRVAGIPGVYLAPGSADLIVDYPSPTKPADFVLPAAATLFGLKSGRIVAYAVDHSCPLNVTQSYLIAQSVAPSEGPPRVVRIADPLNEPYLGDGWYPAEEGQRWMAKEAVVRLGGPKTVGSTLHLRGVCPAALVKQGPLEVIVRIDGKTMKPVPVREGDFDLSFPLAPELVSRTEIEIAIHVDRTFRPADDDRDLGLAFGTVEIR
jgi:hypothetical protein